MDGTTINLIYADGFIISSAAGTDVVVSGDLKATATELNRDPKKIKISVMTSALVGADKKEYSTILGAAAAQRGKEPAELEASYAKRRVIHGTYEQAAEQIAQYGSEGVGRIYIQHFNPLNELDTSDFARQLEGLAGG